MSTFFSQRFALTLLVGGSLLVASCKKTEDVQPVGIPTTTAADTTNSAINNWILANMRFYYFWTDNIPANPDKSLAPNQFFNLLLYDYNNTANINRDRFSWIQQSADDLKASLGGQSKSTGIEYKLYYADQSKSAVIASIIYTVPNSPAAKAGIKRGDIISTVNGTALNGTNYSSLLSSNADSYTYGFATLTNGVLTNTGQTKLVSAQVIQEDPVFMDSTYTIGGKTIGYIVYNQFVPGLYGVKQADGSMDITYDTKLDNIFGKFKQKGVTELVLDLRYNRGGYVNSSTNLSSLIGKNIDASKVYFTQQWNANTTALYDKKYGAGWNTQNFLTKATNIGANLSRVFILTTSSTASASELVINGLRPFMTVTTIGTTTVGKNVGSITLSDPNNYIKWGIQPITFKSANAQGNSDYAGGFAPSVTLSEPSYGMKALGDVMEPLLNEALYQISGSRLARRAATESSATEQPSLGSSLDRKAGGGNMFMDGKAFKSVY